MYHHVINIPHCDNKTVQSSIPTCATFFTSADKHKAQHNNEAPSAKQAKLSEETNKFKLDSRVTDSSKCMTMPGMGKLHGSKFPGLS